jgi:hypothetical protein
VDLAIQYYSMAIEVCLLSRLNVRLMNGCESRSGATHEEAVVAKIIGDVEHTIGDEYVVGE